jgi:hypothetical protein
MTRTKRLLTGSAVVVALVMSAAPAVASSKAPNVHPWLLSLSDMPVGWSATAAPAPSRSGCLSLGLALLGEHPGSSGSVAYEENQAPVVLELLVSWAISSAARHAYEVTTTGGNRCHQFKFQGTTVTVAALNLGRYGNLSSAYQITYTESGTAIGDDFDLVLKGRAVLEFSYADEDAAMTGDLSQIQGLLTKAVGKVKG